MPHCSVSSRFKTTEDEETARFEKHRPPVKDQIYINFMYITDEGYLRGGGVYIAGTWRNQVAHYL